MRVRVMRGILYLCLILAVSLSWGRAQRLSGRIFDADGSPLPMATIQVQGLGKGTVSAVDGRYQYNFSTRGVYRISVRYTGYESLNAVVRINRDTTVDFTLHPTQSQLDAVVITGTRTPKMLKDVPVVEFSRLMDGQVVMNMQGMGGSDVLFLIDGERMAGESLNNIDYERLNMDNIERVEIVRGAGSALYGSNAIGGVVNIITKEADQPWSLNLNGRYGSHNEQKYGATLGFDKKKFNSMTGVSYKTIDTYTLRGKDSASAISYIYGGRTLNVNQSLRYDFLPNLSLKLRGGFYHRERDYSQTRIDRYIDGTAGAVLTYDINEKAHLRADYAFDLYDKYKYFPRAGRSDKEYSNMQNKANVQFDYGFSAENILTLGVEYFNET